MSDHFIPFKGTTTSTAGKLLAINPASVVAIFSEWSKSRKQYVLVIALINNRRIAVSEEDAPQTLEDLGLGQFSDSWVLDLVEDLG
jgi:hypothetical protein